LERTWQQIAALRKDPDQEETPIELSGFLTTGE
jgi:hypothetical protein